jgi:hypothetical protein
VVICETGDIAEVRARLRRLQGEGADPSMIRIDTLCGRPEYPTGYRVSRFATHPPSGPGADHAGN